MDILEELKIKTNNCAIPGWAARAAKEIETLRGDLKSEREKVTKMNLTHCPHCGKQLEPEINRPAGCICDALEWSDPCNIPPVCDKFDEDHVGRNCNRCEHDYGCHAEAHHKGG